MSEAKVAGSVPVVLQLDAGTYYWCACGRSKNQPFCDGSHQGTGIEPVACMAEISETVYLCGCKRTASQPFCDGTHNSL